MANPQISQGTINRLVASIIVANSQELNITPSFLDKAGIRLAFSGDSTLYIDTMTGAVTSGEPYVRVSINIPLLKSQSFSDLYKRRIESNSIIGPITVRPDVVGTLSPWDFDNCSILGVDEVTLNGTTAGYNVRLGGVYQINANLWG